MKFFVHDFYSQRLRQHHKHHVRIVNNYFSMCPHDCWLRQHHVNVVNDYTDTVLAYVCIKQCIKLHFFLLLSLVFLFQCQQLPGHMIFAYVCKYLCKNKKILLNCFCMFIWGTGKLFWQQNCWRARDTVPLIFEIKMYFNGKKSFLTWNNVYEYSLCLDYVIFKTSYHYLCTRVCFFNNFKVWKFLFYDIYV